MELKGKMLKDFWKWYLQPEQKKKYKTNSLLGSNPAIKVRFLSLSFTERFGVFLDFFDAQNIQISIIAVSEYKTQQFKYWTYYLITGIPEIDEEDINETEYENVTEAQLAAIEKAQEIYKKL